MRISGTGAVVGAVVGGLARGAVVAFHAGGSVLWLALPSAGVGALVGAIAGATGRPARGAAVGAALSVLFFGLTMATGSMMLDLAGSAVGEERAGRPLWAWSVPYFLQMGLAGAIGGGIGGVVGNTIDGRRGKAGPGPGPGPLG